MTDLALIIGAIVLIIVTPCLLYVSFLEPRP